MIERALLALFAVLAALGLVGTVYQAQRAERARTQLNELRTAVAESAARQSLANQQEGARRVFRQSEAIDVQVRKTEAAEAAAARARNERDGLRRDLDAYAASAASADPAASSSCPTAAASIAVLARLLDRCGERREELARFADRAWIAGEACQRSYEALTDPN